MQNLSDRISAQMVVPDSSSAEAFEAVSNEMAKTLRVLVDHPVLKNDVQFQTLSEALMGVADMDLFLERVMALEIYVKRLAQAYGVDVKALVGDGANRIVMRQMPDHIAALDDADIQRTRLQMR